MWNIEISIAKDDNIINIGPCIYYNICFPNRYSSKIHSTWIINKYLSYRIIKSIF